MQLNAEGFDAQFLTCLDRGLRGAQQRSPIDITRLVRLAERTCPPGAVCIAPRDARLLDRFSFYEESLRVKSPVVASGITSVLGWSFSFL